MNIKEKIDSSFRGNIYVVQDGKNPYIKRY